MEYTRSSHDLHFMFLPLTPVLCVQLFLFLWLMYYFRYHASVLITEDYVDMEIGFAVEHNKRDAREMACRAALQELEQREEVMIEKI